MADLSPAEVAAQTGLSRSLIYRLIETGELPAYKVANRLRIAPEDLAAFKERNTIKPRPKTPAYEPVPRKSRADDDFRDRLREIRRYGRV